MAEAGLQEAGAAVGRLGRGHGQGERGSALSHHEESEEEGGFAIRGSYPGRHRLVAPFARSGGEGVLVERRDRPVDLPAIQLPPAAEPGVPPPPAAPPATAAAAAPPPAAPHDGPRPAGLVLSATHGAPHPPPLQPEQPAPPQSPAGPHLPPPHLAAAAAVGPPVPLGPRLGRRPARCHRGGFRRLWLGREFLRRTGRRRGGGGGLGGREEGRGNVGQVLRRPRPPRLDPLQDGLPHQRQPRHRLGWLAWEEKTDGLVWMQAGRLKKKPMGWRGARDVLFLNLTA